MKWQGLDRYGNLNESVDWEGDFTFHKLCKPKFMDDKRLAQALLRKEKEAANESAIPTAVELPAELQEKRSTRSSTGTVHDKNLCIWCMRGADTRYPDRKDAVLNVNEEDERWAKIKASVRDLKDVDMQVRLKKLVTSTTDPFADEIPQLVL